MLHALVKSIRSDIESAESTSPEGLNQEQIAVRHPLLITGFTLALTPSQNFNSCTNKLYVYYTIAGDTSSTFAEVTRRYIMPGINKVDSLSSTKTQRADIEQMIEGIAQYSKDAQKEIHDLVEKVRDPPTTNL